MSKTVMLSEGGALYTHAGDKVTFANLSGVTKPVTALLTHSAVGGTANGTLVDCTASYSEAAVEENFKELATKLNELIQDLTDIGLISTS